MIESSKACRLPDHRIILALALAILPASRLASQANPDSVKQRNDCRLAMDFLETGHPSPEWTDALTTIGLCGSQGEATLIKVWSDDALSRHDLELLVTSTRISVSPRLVEAMFRVAEEPSYSTEHRVAALLVLTTYADSYLLPGFGDLIGARDELVRNRFGHIDHPYNAFGRESLAEPVMERLLPALEQLKASDPNPEMQTAAEVLLLNLK